MNRQQIPGNFLPHDFIGRLALGLLSAIFIPPSAVFLFAFTFAPAAATWGWWLVRISLWEFFAALLAASVCGLIWAVAAPKWLPVYALRYSRRLGLLALVPFVILAGMLVWPS